MAHSVTNVYPVATADQSSGAVKILKCDTCAFVIRANDVNWGGNPVPVIKCVICPDEPALVEPTYNGTDEQYEW